MSNTREAAIIRPLSLISLMVLFLVVSGCTGLQNMLGGARQPAGARDEAIQKYSYKGDKNALFAETPVVTPPVVSGGSSINQTYQFAVLGPDKNKQFQVQEVITLSGADIVIELSRKVFEKPQGAHVSSTQFLVPKDLPRGSYKLITLLSITGSSRKLTGIFSVR